MKKNTVKKRIFSIILTIFIIFSCNVLFTGCASSYQDTKTSFALDTVISITYYDEKDEQAVSDALLLISELELVFSRTNENSELYAVNKTIETGGAAHVSDILYDALFMARVTAEKSGGKFDFTLGKISDMWNFTSENPHVPDQEALFKALSHTGYEHITLTDDHFISSDDPEISLDLGGMAKGYIGELAKQQMIENGVTSAILNLGGNVITIGSKPDGKPFQVGISKPEKDTSEYATVIEISDSCVVTSGIYQRYFEDHGKWYHHILDSSTGYPVDSDVASATVICSDSALADLLSTTLFAMGPDATMDHICTYNTYIEAVFIMKDGSIHRFTNF